MKRLLTIGLMLFIAQSVVFGQLSLRPQAGINFASFTEDLADENWTSNVGYQFGLDLQIGGALYVQPGMNYQQTVLTYEGAEDIKLTTSRLNIPVLVGFKFFEQEDASFGLRVFGGPNLALHLGEDFEEAIEGLSGDDFESAQWSVLAGAGLDLGIFFLDLGYKWGLTDVISSTDLDSDTNKHIFIANVGVRIGF
jgi:hypothetical protein